MKFLKIVSETHYAAFFQVGTALKKQIKNRTLQKINSLGKKYTTLCNKANLIYKNVEKEYPKYYQELQGLADGSGLKLEEILLANCSDIYDMEEHCTSVVVKDKNNNFLLAHNEDESSPDFKKDAYNFDVTIGEDNSHYFGFGVCRSLIGASISSSNSVIQFVNTLKPTTAIKGLPRNVVARILLDIKNPNDLIKTLNKITPSSSYHHTIFFRKQRRLYSVEYANNKRVIKKIDPPFTHTNHFLSHLKKNNNITSDSSNFRYDKCSVSMGKIKSRKDLMKLMSDKTGSSNGVSRPTTIYSVIITDNLKEVYLAKGRPTKVEDYKRLV